MCAARRKRKRRKRDTDSGPPPPRTAEQLLIDSLPEVRGKRVLCTSVGRGQLAAEIARRNGEARVTCHFLDVYDAERMRALYGDVANLEVVCTADPPADEIDLAAFPFGKGNEAELTRETLQAGYEALREGGRMSAAVDNPKDQWLHGQMQALFDKVTRTPQKQGVVYGATKKGPLKKRKDFGCEFAFRDGETLVKAYSRPGVFSHRRIDTGSRALLEAVSIEPSDRVLDLGCGAGVLTAAAALRAPEGHVLGVDSNARAVACTERTAALNGLTNVTTRLNATAECDAPGTYDVVLGNPPYFSQFEIAGLFLRGAHAALRPGGLAVFVTRKPEWFVERMTETFAEVTSAEVRRYGIVAATKG